MKHDLSILYKLKLFFKGLSRIDHHTPHRDWFWMLVVFSFSGLVIVLISVSLFFLTETAVFDTGRSVDQKETVLDEERLDLVLRHYREKESLLEFLSQNLVPAPPSPAEPVGVSGDGVDLELADEVGSADDSNEVNDLDNQLEDESVLELSDQP